LQQFDQHLVETYESLSPKGWSVRVSVFSIISIASSGPQVARARNPNAPALEEAATNSGVATHPIAVWIIGYLQPKMFVNLLISSLRYYYFFFGAFFFGVFFLVLCESAIFFASKPDKTLPVVKSLCA